MISVCIKCKNKENRQVRDILHCESLTGWLSFVAVLDTQF